MKRVTPPEVSYPPGFFSEPVVAWTQMKFKSRTCDPKDPCFVGRVGAEANKGSKPAQAAVAALQGQVRWDQTPEAAGTRGAQVIALIRVSLEMGAGMICSTLGIGRTGLSAVVKPLVDAQVLQARRVGRELHYSMGPRGKGMA